VLGEEFGDRDVVFKELGHRGVQVLLQSRIKELRYCDVVGGGAATVQELSDSHIVGALVKELGHRNVVGIKELSHSRVEVVDEVSPVLAMVSGEKLVKELSHCNIVAVQVLGHSDTILAVVKELSDSDIVGAEELRDDVIKELGHRDIVLFKVLGK